METKINKTKSKFGIEVELYIVDQEGYPVLNSYKLVSKESLKVDPMLKITNETSSFQIEINPGPWSLNSIGLNECIDNLKHHLRIIDHVVELHNWKLCTTLMPRKLSQDIINHPDYTTKSPRYYAFAKYFTKNNDVILKSDELTLTFPGEMILGCINEIHIHAQLSSDDQNIDLFNYLNFHGLNLTKRFNQPIEINNNLFKDIDSLLLFEQANGEWNHDHSLKRVGNLPQEIKNYLEYQIILDSFEKIPFDEESYLEQESSIYFWTRLRGVPGDLRVEFRPMEMGEDWIERVKYLYKIIEDFENKSTNPDSHSHL